MLTVGIDVGGTSVRAGVVDAAGTVIDTVRAPTPRTDAALEDTLAAAVRELAGRHPVAAVGLAVAGFVTADRTGVRFAAHLPWRDAPVVERMTRRTGLSVVLEHDANAAAVAEYRFGAARGAGVVVLVALGTGIGGALLVNGAVYRGAHGVAPEFGHLRVVPDGRPCPCGKRGCWERYCSGTALVATAAELLADPVPDPHSRLDRPARGVATSGAPDRPDRPAPATDTPDTDDREVRLGRPTHRTRTTGRWSTGVEVAAAAAAGDPVARRAVSELARWLGEGLAVVADVYDPELVVIGGGVSASAGLFLDEARAHYASALTGAGHRPLAVLRPALLGDDAGIVGAATLAADRTR